MHESTNVVCFDWPDFCIDLQTLNKQYFVDEVVEVCRL